MNPTYEKPVVFLTMITFFVLLGFWLYYGFLLASHGAGNNICTDLSGNAYQCGE